MEQYCFLFIFPSFSSFTFLQRRTKIQTFSIPSERNRHVRKVAFFIFRSLNLFFQICLFYFYELHSKVNRTIFLLCKEVITFFHVVLCLIFKDIARCQWVWQKIPTRGERTPYPDRVSYVTRLLRTLEHLARGWKSRESTRKEASFSLFSKLKSFFFRKDFKKLSTCWWPRFFLEFTFVQDSRKEPWCKRSRSCLLSWRFILHHPRPPTQARLW